ncbi:hypothetical protein AALP_AA5G043500 [Arabis alpina]|uniref:Cytochrome p450 n=1 Tax=Arabis alpina TaxID=50452 RepID=A0A087GUW2_ARAAL|nr:hypothetical protein AALP_AA5G043500 [Arabis alpina]
MAMLSLLEISIAFFCFLIFLISKKRHRSFPTNWPFLGMLPGLLVEIPRVYDFVTEFLEDANLNFLFKGPFWGGLDMLVTVDPANIHHIMSSNFANYPKGTEFKKLFDILGDGIFNADSELWNDLRKSAQSMMMNPKFQKFSLATSLSKLEKGLLPLLDHVAKEKLVVDLEDVFQRFTFDTTCVLATGYDPGCLSVEMPEIEFARALDDAEEAIFFRHVMPELVWKMQRLVGFGDELKLKRARATVDRVCSTYIASRRDMVSREIDSSSPTQDLLTSYMNLDTTKYKLLNPSDDRFLRDTILTFMLAGRDPISSALTWFFWLLYKNQDVIAKIRQEINTNLFQITKTDVSDDSESFNPQELKKLVYLHGAIYEVLRLYPPLPFNHKSPTKSEVLPSGHKVDANSKIVLCLYSLGRMKSVWGEDAFEFKPERWISETGKLIHEPSYKFLSFNAGPRTCLGKELAMMQIKTVAVKIIQNYEIKVVEGQKIEPAPSVILHMKHGLKVTVSKRCLV